MLQSVVQCNDSWYSVLWCTYSCPNVESSVHQDRVRNERIGTTNWLEAGVSRLWIHTALSLYCNWCMLTLVYAVLSVNPCL